MFSPGGEEGWLVFAEVFLEGGVEFDVVGVVEEEVELDFGVAGALQEGGVEPVGFGFDLRWIGGSVEVLEFCAFEAEEFAEGVAVGGGGVFPIFLDGVPGVAELLLRRRCRFG